MRSFSNLWFWIALAVMWSSASHWVLGVPWDMVLRARKRGDQPMADMEAMVQINVRRILFIAQESGLLIAGFSFFLLTSLGLLGFVYDREFAQAVFLLGLPMSLVWLLTVFTATRIRDLELEGIALIKCLNRHRTIVQVIGIISIFVTAMWGMLQNMSSSALGG
ncbi:component of SufBCD complex [Roseovarius aestuarii]|nr:component of SufBCD complex [Roseovarius aestuarii]